MEMVSSEGVPGLEGEAARKGTVNAEAIGAARYWFKEAEKLREKLRGRRALAFSCGVVVGAVAADLVLRWWVL